MTEEVCKNIIAFMARANLTGDEVPAFNECVAAIRAQYDAAVAEASPASE